ncbi:Hypothetical predicted protein [Olea europaea subsp. europaea]|uniref:Pre-rRNA-processing protein TSR2 homolog n=1 Tax=Olea europaea subsp. europaea TaxID=158383 RepID=A0A8S0UXQ3_OLEEU|nr:Hypothetical predicted protein [Olea europaea subsp. europaea]
MVGTNKNLVLTAEAAAQLHEGINLVLSRWTALRIAVNECRSHDSTQKPQQLAQILFQALIQSKEKVYTDDLDNMLYDFLMSLKTIADDGSIEEVAEKLVFMHEECAEGNFNSIKSLKETNAPSVYYVRQDRSDDEDDSDDDGHDGDISTEMRVDAPDSSLNEEDMMIDEPSPEEVAEVEAGWTVVASKRNKAGRRN